MVRFSSSEVISPAGGFDDELRPPRVVISSAEETVAEFAEDSAEEAFISEFKRSDFLRFLTRYSSEHRTHDNHRQSNEVIHLRMENEMLQAQLKSADRPLLVRSPRVAFAETSSSELFRGSSAPDLLRHSATDRSGSKEDTPLPNVIESSEADAEIEVVSPPRRLPGLMTTKTSIESISNADVVTKPPVVRWCASDSSTESVELETVHSRMESKIDRKMNSMFSKHSQDISSSDVLYRKPTAQPRAAMRHSASTSYHHHVFVDVDLMKEQVRLAVSRPQHNVHNYYYETGLCQAIAKHPAFEVVTLAVIAFNAIWIAIETDKNESSCDGSNQERSPSIRASL